MSVEHEPFEHVGAAGSHISFVPPEHWAMHRACGWPFVQVASCVEPTQHRPRAATGQSASLAQSSCTLQPHSRCAHEGPDEAKQQTGVVPLQVVADPHGTPASPALEAPSLGAASDAPSAAVLASPVVPASPAMVPPSPPEPSAFAAPSPFPPPDPPSPPPELAANGVPHPPIERTATTPMPRPHAAQEKRIVEE